VLPAGALASVLTANGLSASVPSALVASTTKAAILLAAGQATLAAGISLKVGLITEGVLKTMLIAKLKMTTVFVCGVAALGLCTGGVIYEARAGALGSKILWSESAAAGFQRAKGQPNLIEDQEEDQEQTKSASSGSLEAQQQEAIERLEKARMEAEKYLEEARIQFAMLEKQKRAVEGNERIATKRLEEITKAEAKARDNAAATSASASSNQRKAKSTGENAKTDQSDDLIVSTKEKIKGLEEAQVDLNKQTDLARLQLEKLRADRDEMALQTTQTEEQLRLLFAERDKLSVSQSKLMAVLRETIHAAAKMPQKTKPINASPSGTGGKLDRILERMERLEQRLDRLENRKP
jgi:hypothetical protein